MKALKKALVWAISALGVGLLIAKVYLKRSVKKAVEAKAKVDAGVQSALAAAKLRAKVTEAKKAKIEAEVVKEQARDSVDVANDILRTLDADSEHKS